MDTPSSLPLPRRWATPGTCSPCNCGNLGMEASLVKLCVWLISTWREIGKHYLEKSSSAKNESSRNTKFHQTFKRIIIYKYLTGLTTKVRHELFKVLCGGERKFWQVVIIKLNWEKLHFSWASREASLWERSIKQLSQRIHLSHLKSNWACYLKT